MHNYLLNMLNFQCICYVHSCKWNVMWNVSVTLSNFKWNVMSNFAADFFLRQSAHYFAHLQRISHIITTPTQELPFSTHPAHILHVFNTSRAFTRFQHFPHIISTLSSHFSYIFSELSCTI